jgi:eukaryotic-like serine/threonine-protein kinase
VSLPAGTRLGPYEITAALGAGGMGEVYRATDTRLARTVAIKVLAATLAADQQFRERFEREAWAVSQLNHPNICTLHDVGDQDGTAFLVMEYLEGETLAERIAKGPLPLEQVLDYALQIADALDRAHRHGIIHRDLKPANVMLLRSGAGSLPSTCKLLDFGLAKMGVAAASGTVETRMLSTPALGAGQATLTSQGSIIGTFQYMAPEQIEGQNVGARADIWAFGCVLYEMATGKRPFAGKSQASLIAAILEREPTPMSELQPMTPPALGRVVRTCLAKDPDDRFQTAHDLRLQLQWIEEGGSAAGLPAPVIAHRRHHDRMIWLGIAAVVGLASGAAAWALKPAPPVTPMVSRFEYALPDDQQFTRGGRHLFAISPDGARIAYVANRQLYLRSLDQLDAQPVRGSEQDPLDPVFSPDGQWIAYFAAPKEGPTARFILRKIAAAGGSPVTLAETSAPFGATWQGSTIAFGQHDAGKDPTIIAVPDSGGTARALVTIPVKEGRATQPDLLPDGRRVLFHVGPRGSIEDDGEIVVQTFDGSPRVVLVVSGRNPRRLSTGHLVYFQNGTLFAAVVDWDRLTVVGTPVPVLEGVAGNMASRAGQFAVSRTGTLVYRPGTATNSPALQPFWVDRKGGEQPVGAKPRFYQDIRLSPDGTKIALSVNEDQRDIWVWDIARETLTRLTFGAALEHFPVWTPDSKHVVFMSSPEGGPADIYRKAADSTGPLDALTKGGAGGAPQSFSPDGQLVFEKRATGGADLMLLPADDSGPKPLLASPDYAEQNGSVSPDGRWIAYQSNETGVNEVYVRPFPNVGSGRWQISDGGGVRPEWSRSGRELFFVSTFGGDLSRAQMMTVSVTPGASFESGKPLGLFRVTPLPVGIPQYEVTRDGGFLFVKAASDAAENARHRFVVVTNWIEDVKARLK